MKIIAYGIRDDEKPYLDEWVDKNGIEVKVVQELLDADTVNQAKGFDGVVAYQQQAYTADIFAKLDEFGIHAFSIRNVGVDNIDVEAVKKYNIKVTNVPVYSPEAIAEFSVTQLMQLLRRTKEYNAKFARRDFRWAPQISKELHNRTVGVIGTGHIGQAAIRIYQGFGAKVLAYDVHRNAELDAQGLYVDSLDDIYQNASVITLHIPLLKSTEHMLNKEAFDKMQDGTFIVNASRGPLVNEQDLIAALDSGKVAGAALDVMEKETKVFNHDMAGKETGYPEFDNLFPRENVLISPHTAFYTEVAVRNMVQYSLNNNKQLIETGKADNLVKF